MRSLTSLTLSCCLFPYAPSVHSDGGGVNKTVSVFQTHKWHWLLWLSGCSAGLQTKGRRLDSPSEHMPGFWTRSPVGACERQPHMDVSVPPSLSLCLSPSSPPKTERKRNNTERGEGGDGGRGERERERERKEGRKEERKKKIFTHETGS